MIDLNELAKQSFANAFARECHGANVCTETRKMLKHCATEVVEAMEAYAQRYDWGNGYFESELADIICCVLIIAGKEEIDIEKALLDCIEKNRRRAEGTGDKL